MRHFSPVLLLLAASLSSTALADPGKARQLVDQAADEFNRGNQVAARDLIEKAIVEQPDLVEAWLVRCSIWKGAGFPDVGLRYVTEAMRLMTIQGNHPNDSWGFAYFQRSNVYFDLDRYADALKDAVEAERLAPGMPMVTAARGRALVGIGDHEQGLQILEAAMVQMPVVLIMLTHLTWVRGEWDLLLKRSNQLDSMEGAKDIGVVWRGIADVELGKFEEAKQEIEKIRARQPNGSVVRTLTGYLLGTPAYAGADANKSLAAYKELLDLGVSQASLLSQMARTMFLAGRYAECRDFVSTKGRRTNFPCMFWLGAAQWKLEEYSEARLTLMQARRYNPAIANWAAKIEGLPEYLKSIETDVAAERKGEVDSLKLAIEGETWLVSSAEIEGLVRRFHFSRAAAEYEKLLPSLVSSVRRREVESRIVEVKAMATALDKLVAAVNKKSVTLKPKVGAQELTITKADDRAFDFTIPKGSGKFPWAYLEPLEFFRFANPQAATPEEHFALGVLLWDMGEAKSAQQNLETASKGALKDRISAVVARKRGIDAPAGGFVLYKGSFVTTEEKQNLEKGLVRFKGTWVPAADRPNLAKGMVKVDGKWLPGDEKKLLDAGYRKFKGQWMALEDYETLRSKWENAFEEETEHYKVRSNAGEAFTKDLAAVIELAYAEYKKFYDGREPKLAKGEKMTLYAFGSYDDYRRHCIERRAEDSLKAGGFASSDSNVVAGWNKTGSRHLFLQTMVHEGAHLYYFRTSSPSALPSWHAEGMATWFEGFEGSSGAWKFNFSNASRAAFAKEAASGAGWIPLRDLLESDAGKLINADSTKALVFYAEAWSLNAFLTQTGDAKLRDAYKQYRDALASGKAEAFSKFFPDMEALEKSWKATASGQ
ncbi:MAG: hypothetical protein FD180_3156 [Planctomycetota bacterium]|nr:MAG: hypothetical protein FD180_3156 [Planctomycetota bacterium]